MKRYSKITIIYNPNSTGPSKQKANKLATALQKTFYNDKVDVVATNTSGHAEALAYDLAKKTSRPLIISSSGDGGYHEVVNGIMKARREGSKAVAGLLPGGNANDHFHNLHASSLEKQILNTKPRLIDLLEVSIGNTATNWRRYAHSYVGVGLTPQVGRKLSEKTLNRINEKVIALKVFLKLKSVNILVGNEQQSYDSLVFSNVAKMSKYLKLSGSSAVDDGAFEITALPNRSKFFLMRWVLQSVRGKVDSTPQVKRFDFKTMETTDIQLDGEVYSLETGAQVTIKVVPRALECLV